MSDPLHSADHGVPSGAPAPSSGFNLSRWALEHSALVRYLMVVLLLLGVAAYFQLGQDEDPPFTFRVMVVRTNWPGATAQQVAEQVTDKIERTQLLQRHAERQAFLDLGTGLLQGLAQGDDVAALGHRHTQRNHFVPVVAHLDLRRIDQAALDLRDVAQTQLVARSTTNRHGTQLLDVVELPATLNPGLDFSDEVVR